MNQPRAIIYGANGYTGRLIARQAVARGMRPTLAGRNHDAITALAKELDCPAMSFGLRQPLQVAEQIEGFSVVLNCAGPFSQTARMMIEACLSVGADYLDITGEIDVIELAASLGDRAKGAGVSLMPAVGFDVVPSDCLAAMLAEKLPGASVLELAFATTEGISPGTAKTVLETLPRGGRARINGQIRHVPIAWKTREVEFRHHKLLCMTVPWGDVASAYYSTGIGNIEVYSATPPSMLTNLRRFRFVLPVLTLSPIQGLLKRWIGRKILGPTDEARQASRASFWGRVADDHGRSVSATLETMSGYQLTSETAAAALELALARQTPRGFATPSQAFGRDFILRFPHTDVAWEVS